MYQPQLKTSRLSVVCLGLVSILVLLGFRLVWLQLFKDQDLSSLASKQKNLVLQLAPHRGKIYDRNFNLLAMSLQVDSIYANPAQIVQKAKVAQELSMLLGVNQEQLCKKFHRKGYFTWVKRWCSEEEVKKVKQIGIEGIGVVKESKRFYPNGSLASHVIGVSGMDGVGLEGIEKMYDHYLKGSPGWLWVQRDARGRSIAARIGEVIPPLHGYDVVLTIDQGLQYIVERELDHALSKIRFQSASVVVMDPKNGDILALVNRPTFDPNHFQLTDSAVRRNRAITDFFEPGSVFKIVTASVALAQGKVKLDQKFFCENGAWKVAGHILHDHKPHGWLTFPQVIEKSSNIGTVKIAQLVGSEELYRYIKIFGFGSPTQIELPGEVAGIIRPPREWSKTSMTAIPMGQEVTTTVMQLASAFSVIANGGTWVKPRMVLEVRDRMGEPIEKNKTQNRGRIVTPEVAVTMKEILKAAVEEGTGTLAKVKGYTVAGKTGTAQKIEPNGTYSHSRFVASFVGFAPVENPQLTIAIIVDEPRPYYYGGVVSAPIFKSITQEALRYLEIPRKVAEPMIVATEER